MQINDYVKKYDPQNQFDVLINSYQQIEFAWSNDIKITGINASEYIKHNYKRLRRISNQCRLD